jgi:hypothetical protein
MHFIETVKRYYIRELKQCFGSAVWGGILIVCWALVFRPAPSATLVRGLAIPSLVAGLIFGIGGLFAGFNTRRTMTGRLSLFHADQKAFFDQEVLKVERTHRAWRRIRAFWGMLTGIGVGLALFASAPFLTGVGVGTFVLSFSGHIEEAISMRFNERYYRAVLAEVRK